LDNSEQAARVALIVRAGDGNGAAIARRFACEGYYACVVRRSAAPLAALVTALEAHGRRARAFGAVARRADAFVGLFKQIERGVGPNEVLVFNIGAVVPCSFSDDASRTNCQLTRGTPRETCW
jgi:NAD(P)-dependent dehydrogenase (short-subunit alcohol dehydrogenase family)